eukprot:3519616-Pyramimonas_sp.AAC.1
MLFDPEMLLHKAVRLLCRDNFDVPWVYTGPPPRLDLSSAGPEFSWCPSELREHVEPSCGLVPLGGMLEVILSDLALS